MEELEKVFVATIWPVEPSTSTKWLVQPQGQDYKMVKTDFRLQKRWNAVPNKSFQSSFCSDNFWNIKMEGV